MTLHKAQRGVALLVVLWACTLLAIVAGGYAALARTEGEQTRNSGAQSRARYAAEAGVMRAIYEVYNERMSRKADLDEAGRWIGDGRPYVVRFDGVEVTVAVHDETGKVDINAADAPLIAGLLVAAGADAAKAKVLAENIVYWRSPGRIDAGAVSDYQSAGKTYLPRRARFPNVEELQAVLGMDGGLYARIEPAITIWSGRNQPLAYFASPLALEAMPGIDRATAEAYVSQRDMSRPGATLAVLPGNVSGSYALGSNALTVVATARAAGAAAQSVQATIRFDQLQPMRDPRRPLYTVLRWRDMVGS